MYQVMSRPRPLKRHDCRQLVSWCKGSRLYLLMPDILSSIADAPPHLLKVAAFGLAANGLGYGIMNL